MDRALARAGYVERTLATPEVALNYAEGPRAGPSLLLIPGQSMPWQSYTRVLPALARRFHVLALDVRGHGKSGRTPGQYTFVNLGRDAAALLEHAAAGPALVSGNSSGGVIAVWVAANRPELVRGLLPEDPPLFSCEWPRLRDDCWAYRFFEHAVRTLGSPAGRDLGAFFEGFEVPMQGRASLLRFPRPLAWAVGLLVRAYRRFRPEGPIDLPLVPFPIRLLIRAFSEYDVEFTRAFLGPGPGQGFSHAEALARVRCPMLLLKAHAFRHPALGLVGAMDAADVERTRQLVPGCRVVALEAAHQIHVASPRAFVQTLLDFERSLPG